MKSLNDNGVRYLLVGGYAVCFHGYCRPTQDLDIWIAVEADNAHAVRNCLVEFAFAEEHVDEAWFLETNKIVRMGVIPWRIELFTSILGVAFEACWERRVEGDFFGKDLADLENLPEQPQP
ncbi:MAG: hypothetical protein HYU66_06150 [Armatimonadetes bacterium]|nr:hypothetical protein [Armatimonadota bacterium]